MTREALSTIQARFCSATGMPALDLAELSAMSDGSWDAWAQCSPGLDHPDLHPQLPDDAAPEAAFEALDRQSAAYDRWHAELERRQRLVAHAKSLVHWAKSERAVEQSAMELERFRGSLAREPALRDRASEVVKRIRRLKPRAQRSAATFTLRCDQGCPLLLVFAAARTPENGTPTLLAISDLKVPRVGWLVLDTAEPTKPRELGLRCRHGSGTFPLVVESAVGSLDLMARLTRRVSDLPGVAWTPRSS